MRIKIMSVKLIYLFAIFLILYAHKNWFHALCGLIVMMAVIEYPDMPKSLGGIQGMNLWNLVLLSVVLAWSMQRRREELSWDMPMHLNILLLLYLLVILVGFFRAFVDLRNLPYMTTASFVSEDLFNTLKWVIPGLLIYDGCRTRRRVLLAIGAVLAIYVLLSIQVIRWIPHQYALRGADLEARSRKIIQNEIGFSRVNMAMMLAGGSWAFLALLPLARSRKKKLLCVAGFFFVAYGQVLTGGRMGYGTWAMVGFILCCLRWRKGLLAIPAFVLFVVIFLPGVTERMTEGFGLTGASGKTYTSEFEVTAGRTFMWPYVLKKIGKRPLAGYGREAMRRTGITSFLESQYNEVFPHPHNAYLEQLFDNGLFGFLIILTFYLLMLVYALRLFLDNSFPLYTAVGGMSLAFILALMVAGAGSQTFYPREGAVGMWCFIGLLLRLTVERDRYKLSALSVQPSVLRYQLSAE
jgi:O-antigen ligase